MKQFIRKDEVPTGIQIKQMFVGLWPFARPHRRQGLIALICMLTSIALARLLPQTIGYAIDYGVLEKDRNVLIQMAWVFLVLKVGHALFQFLYVYLFQKFGNRVLADLREALFGHVQSLPLDYFHRNPIGRIVNRLTSDTANLNEVFGEGVVSIVSSLLILISLVISMAFISVKLTAITLFLTPIFIYASVKISGLMADVLRESKKKLATLSSFASESLQGARILQILNALPYAQNRILKDSEEYQSIILKSIRTSALMQPLLNLFTAVVITSALAGGGALSINEGLALGSLVAFLMHAQDFIPPLRDILEKYQQFQNSLTSTERVFGLFQETSEFASEQSSGELGSSSSPLHRPEIPGAPLVELRKLSFRYEEGQPYVFQNLDLKIWQGDRVAIVGRTGAGKSTLISLLQRFYDPPRGSVLVCGQDLLDIPKHQTRTQVGVVQQDAVLFRGNIAENIHLWNPSVTEAQVESALERLGALEYFKRSGRNIHSAIEERGANLSAGERQLICFARVMISNPEILILDEATANIDSETEQYIQLAVKTLMQGRTCLIIAHRLSTLKDCNRFVRIENGTLLEET